MAKPARIRQDDMNRAMKAVSAAGFDHARVIMDLEKCRIEVIIGQSGTDSDAGEWDDEDI